MTNSGLYRSNRQSMIAGVMGGIAERFLERCSFWANQ